MQALIERKGINHALDIVGSQNTYQIRTALVIAFQHLFRSFFLIYMAFLTRPPVFLCADPNNPGSYIDCTENTGGCVDKRFSENSPSSLVNDLGFYCETSYIRTLGGSLFFVGGNIGVAYFSYLSDKRGRKVALQHCYLVGSVALLLLGTIANGPFSYCLCMMLIWGGFSCFIVNTLTYVAEFSSEKFARVATALLLDSIVIGQLIAIGLAYYITEWRVLYWSCIVVPALLTNFTFLFLDETPQYLNTKRQYKEAARVLENVARVNNRSLEFAPAGPNPMSVKNSAANQQQEPSTRSLNYIQIIMHPKLTMRVLMYGLIRLYLNLAYFGCIFALASLGGSIYVNSMIAAVAEGLGYTLSLKAHLFSARRLLSTGLFIVGLSGISFLLIPVISQEDSLLLSPLFIQGFLSLIMRTMVCFVYGFVYSLGNELFPVEVRSQSQGIGGIFTDIGGIIAPIILMIAEKSQLNPLFCFGTLGFFALIAGEKLPAEPLASLDGDEDEKAKNVEMNYIRMNDNKA